MAYSKIEQLVFEMAEPLALAIGVFIWDVEFQKEGKNHVLRVYIDKEGGASIDDCEKVSIALSEKLDAQDPIPTAYSLEISSAGLDRRLKRESDFLGYIGHLVDVKLYAPTDGLKEFTAELSGFSNNMLLLRYENRALELPMDTVASVRLAVIF
ncbi:MAG: ribosome maturation factor RimP [Ruminococcaceae bacterium]|nr:ribosome maturation factor RimP [Oscillospiraceae bacterium]